LAALALLATLADSGAHARAPRPDIVIILADDLGFSDLSSYGGEVPTPNIDRIGEAGIRLVGFHNTAKCFPTRASLLTGLYPQQVGRDRKARTPMIGGVTIAESLRAAGYATYMVGKHHGVTNPVERGFDRYWGLRDGAANQFNPGTAARPGEPDPARKVTAGRWWCDDLDCRQGLDTAPGFYSTQAFTRKAIEFVREAAGKDAPYLLYLSYTAPHDPLHAPEETVDRFEGDYDRGWAPIAEARYDRQVALGITSAEAPRRSPNWRDWGALSDAERADQVRRMEIYAAMIAEMDTGIGQVLAEIERAGTLDETLVIFASDNGASAELVVEQDGTEIGDEHPVGSVGRWASLGVDWAEAANTPYRRFKNDAFEGGTASPLLIAWPAATRRADRTERAFAHLIDLHPTLLEAARVPYRTELSPDGDAPPLPGVSLLPLLRGQALTPRPAPVFNAWQDDYAVWDGQWKLVSHEGGLWRLYDRAMDPHETTDVSAVYPDIATRLSNAFAQWHANAKPMTHGDH
jgi:arylsulfatase